MKKSPAELTGFILGMVGLFAPEIDRMSETDRFMSVLTGQICPMCDHPKTAYQMVCPDCLATLPDDDAATMEHGSGQDQMQIIDDIKWMTKR